MKKKLFSIYAEGHKGSETEVFAEDHAGAVAEFVKTLGGSEVLDSFMGDVKLLVREVGDLAADGFPTYYQAKDYYIFPNKVSYTMSRSAKAPQNYEVTTEITDHIPAYIMLWDNEHSCDTDGCVYDTYEEADMAGKEFVWEMCGIEGLDPESEDNPYSYDVVEV